MVSKKVGSTPVQFYTISEMAAKCGRSKHAFTKLIDRGILPDANIRSAPTVISKGDKAGTEVPGTRLYSVEYLAPGLIAFFKTVTQGKTISHDQKNEVIKLFQAEKKHLIEIQKKQHASS